MRRELGSQGNALCFYVGIASFALCCIVQVRSELFTEKHQIWGRWVFLWADYTYNYISRADHTLQSTPHEEDIYVISVDRWLSIPITLCTLCKRDILLHSPPSLNVR